MIKTESVNYRAMVGTSGWSYLLEMSESLDGIKMIINETYDRQIALGYEPNKTYTITCEEYRLYRDDDGKFARREVIEDVIEVYHPEAR